MLLVKRWLCFCFKYRIYFFPLATLLLPLLCCFFLPPVQKNYGSFIFTTISSLGWFFAIRRRENQLKTAAVQLLQAKIRKLMENDEGLRQIRTSLEERQQETRQLQMENQKLKSQVFHAQGIFMKAKGENQQLETLAGRLKEENQCLQLQLDSLLQDCKEKSEESQHLGSELAETLAYQQALNDEYQATFEEQRSMLDRRQAYIGKLESKVQELMYEIRNLLQLESDVAENLPSQAMFSLAKDLPTQLSNELKKIAFKAENIEAASSLTASRYLRTDSNIHNYSLECRQLFDSLREENLGMLFIYAPQSQRAVFANSLFKTWTGCGVEDFFKMDSDIVVSGLKQWISDLHSHLLEGRFGKVVVKTKLHGPLSFYYCLTALNKGPLHHHVLGVLYPMRKNVLCE
ncbi:hypothetical protein [Candidatus Chlamydia sanziniae]|uniref:Uncharacterized protein n=1 Tax=Candidatus Chlamydia sanziniae TaxID=1806891 RepID=A0A1A9HU97_9CHLA|nr:hypothetical protein [Candidatus Chlamydia sanziniae]ANH78558.1 hypothetical protein Cs308_0387 [Candidatus Chlamydia sanziniae]